MSATRAVGQLSERLDDSFQTERAVRPFLALCCVLHENIRAFYRAKDLHGANVEARDVAEAFVALHERGDVEPLRSLDLPPLGRLKAMLPRPWLLELALVGQSEGLDACSEIIRELAADRSSFLDQLDRLKASSSSRVSSVASSLRSTIPSPPEEKVRVLALGPLTLTRGGRPVDDKDWQRSRVRVLLLYLAVHGRALREVVATVLWPDRDDEAAANNLAVTLNYLNRVLEPDRARGVPPWFIRADGTYLELTADEWFSTDGWEFERQVRAGDATANTSQALIHYEDALTLWRGEWLEGIDEDWALAERDRLRALFVRACVRAGGLRLAMHDFDLAVDHGERAARTERWSEPAFRLIVAANLAAKDRAAARRAGERCRAMLSELGVEPEPETAMILRLIDLPVDGGLPA